MNDDYSRTFLVTKFACANCGEALNLSYKKANVGHQQGEPTGADMVEQTVVVYPCRKCYRVVSEVKKALAILNSAGEEARK